MESFIDAYAAEAAWARVSNDDFRNTFMDAIRAEYARLDLKAGRKSLRDSKHLFLKAVYASTHRGDELSLDPSFLRLGLSTYVEPVLGPGVQEKYNAFRIAAHHVSPQDEDIAEKLAAEMALEGCTEEEFRGFFEQSVAAREAEEEDARRVVARAADRAARARGL